MQDKTPYDEYGYDEDGYEEDDVTFDEAYSSEEASSRAPARRRSAPKGKRAKAPKAARPARAGDPAKKLARLEREIEKLESAIGDLTAQEEANATDYQKLMELGSEKAALQEKLDGLYGEWEALADA